MSGIGKIQIELLDDLSSNCEMCSSENVSPFISFCLSLYRSSAGGQRFVGAAWPQALPLFSPAEWGL